MEKEKNIEGRLVPVSVVAVTGSRHQEGYLDLLRLFFTLLAEKGLKVYIERRFGDYLLDRGLEPQGIFTEIFPQDVEAVVSIGGDGTFLRTARWTGRSGVPVLGINTGHLGFLSNYSLHEMGELVDMLRRGEGIVERRSLLYVDCPALPPGESPYALNEVALLKEETSSMISAHVDIDGFLLADYLADGLLVSTPTGSTAYNLSAGGPILQPTLDCMVIAPLAPHSLTLRPMVVDSRSMLSMTVSSRAGHFRLSIDGRSFRVPEGTPVRVERARHYVSVVRRPQDDFASILRHKLHWGQR